MSVNNAILKKHFENLGFDDAYFAVYESEATDEMQNVDSLCDRLYDIRKNGQQIVIYTDFDVDGIMSSIVAYAGLSQLGFNVGLFKPTPADGYGFRPKDVDDICNEFPDSSVILTGDVGISNNEAIDHAKEKGFTVFVTDHHGGGNCSADLAVNPNQYGETYSHKGICGAYVLYKILAKYASKYSSFSAQADIYRLQMFAGIATVSDVMPLIYENRQLVRSSVSLMRYFYNYELANGVALAPPVYSDNYSRAFVGMKKLLDYFTRIRKIRKAENIDEQFYSFYLVPFLNSCKRMDGDMRGIYDIFFSEYVEPFDSFPNMSCVENGIKYVEALSEQRKVLTERYFSELLAEQRAGETENANYMTHGVYITDARPGLLGLLGSKFMGLSGIPTLVINANEDGSYSGSGRNPGWFDFVRQLDEQSINGVTCAGHAGAFGVFIADKSALDRYISFVDTVVLPAYDEMLSEAVSPYISISYKDCVHADFDADTQLIKDFIDEKELFHPFGQEFPEPKFDFYLKPNSDDVIETMFGNEGQHIKLITAEGMELLLFNMALDYEKLKFDNRDKNWVLVCSGTFRYDDFNDTYYDTINYLVKEIRAQVLD